MKKIQGFGLVEIIIGVAIISVGIVAAVSSYSTYVQYAIQNEKNVQASFLLEEGLEAASFLRDKGWTVWFAPLATSTNATYYLTWNSAGSYWATSTTPIYVDGIFLRSVTISSVSRDASDHIVASGTNDPNTKEVTATVTFWQGHASTTKFISTYITNINGD